MSDQQQQPPADSLRMLERMAEAKEGLRLEISKARESPLARLAESSGEGVAAAAAVSYVVWVDNNSSANLGVMVYWGQRDLPGTQQTGGTVYSGQTAPFRLGGANGCATVYAYVLQILYQGNVVASTGVVRPDASDGSPCADAWGIG